MWRRGSGPTAGACLACICNTDGPDVDIHIGCASGPAVAWNPGCMP